MLVFFCLLKYNKFVMVMFFEVEELKTSLGQLGTVLCLSLVQVITRALFDEAFSIT